MSQLLELDAVDVMDEYEDLVSWIADDILPFCRGLMAVNK